MNQHLRPRFTTHNRNQGYNAITDAAYRMGLRLFDEIREVWNDCRHRVADAEIIAAFTVAPNGAPNWATRPEQLWNRVEACEQRQDSQVCRDVVFPLPAFLTDAMAEHLARVLALYIAERLHTPVSVGLHRDADTDAMGLLKPVAERGYQAHLLYPTRRLLEPEEGRVRAGAALKEAMRQGFGTKLRPLENRRMNAGLIKNYDREWRVLGYAITEEAERETDSNHPLDASGGAEEQPAAEPTRSPMAAADTAHVASPAERANEIGAALRLYQQIHADTLDTQRTQAQADAAHEHTARGADMATPSEATSSLKPDLEAARERGRLPDATLSDRFVAHMAVPKDEFERFALFRASGFVWVIQRNLRTLSDATARLNDLLRRPNQDDPTAQQGAAVQREELRNEEATLVQQIATAEAALGRAVDQIQHSHSHAMDIVLNLVSTQDRDLLSSWMTSGASRRPEFKEAPSSPAHQPTTEERS
ncbi:MobA/MobL family protein [Dyella sp. GSA-30]|uniref:MobA/MobL family protein n=1 Tax=Dyella sp. GSA-30 TaxID=2994496 RepID=UPI0024923D36|nr:MobA/MobL family protein [Dyella sp. GSA-30]BDU22909.1 hypothetical protein DYGSA30_43660 [Dyella sp. GSA-30]